VAIECPTGLTADEMFAEIRRLYQEFKALGGMQEHPPAATHDQQTVLMAQIREWGARLKAVTARPRDDEGA
jgi:hypothetical protein